MRTFLLLASLLIASPVAAADLASPVKALMDVMVANWSDDGGDSGGDYFDDAHLKLFSEDFAALYKAAESHVAEAGDEEAGLFDYDPFQGGQDGCPIADLAIGAVRQEDGVDKIDVSFKPYGCFDADSSGTVTHLTFSLITEKGKPVIDDVERLDAYGSQPSLRDELEERLNE